MAETGARPELKVPTFTVENASVFIASHDLSKLTAVMQSLSEFGLGDSVQLAEGWREASHFVNTQVPGQLEANIFLFDGQVDRDEAAQGERQGNRLMHGLWNSYKSSVTAITKKGHKQVIEDGLTPYEASLIFDFEATETIAAQRLSAEALLVGIADSNEGALSYPAQIPLTPYAEVGRAVFERVIAAAAPQSAAA